MRRLSGPTIAAGDEQLRVCVFVLYGEALEFPLSVKCFVLSAADSQTRPRSRKRPDVRTYLVQGQMCTPYG